MVRKISAKEPNISVLIFKSDSVKYFIFLFSGTVKDIVYGEGKRPNIDLPDFVVVEFPNYDGEQFFESEGKINGPLLLYSTFRIFSFLFQSLQKLRAHRSNVCAV